MGGRKHPCGFWGYPACLWATAFGGLHFYWAVGGRRGLGVSAGDALAAERPLWFVVAGLWGVGALCLAGGLLGWALARRPLRGRRGQLLRWAGWGVAAVLLLRAVGVEILLLSDVTQVETSISDGQRWWTPSLWNPWFAVGGVAFACAAFKAGRCPSS